MKRFFYILAAIMLFSSCTMKEFATDTWICSVELRSVPPDNSRPATTTENGGVCLVKADNPDDTGQKAGDSFCIDVHSSHDSFTVVSCDFDLVSVDTKEDRLGSGLAYSVRNGVATISFTASEINIDESCPRTLRLRLRDELSGQEREFTKTFYTYKNFFLNIVFMQENAAHNWVDYEGTETPAVYGGEMCKYKIYSNQKRIVIKDFQWERNAANLNYDDSLFVGMDINLRPDTKKNLYYKEFTLSKDKNYIPETVQDPYSGREESGDALKRFILTAYGEDFNTDIEETVEVEYQRYYSTVLEVQLSTNTNWVTDGYERGHLTRNMPAFMNVRYNRASGANAGTLKLVSVTSSPDITNPRTDGIKWFNNILDELDKEIEGLKLDQVASFPASGYFYLLNDKIPYDYRELNKWDGKITVTFQADKPSERQFVRYLDYSVFREPIAFAKENAFILKEKGAEDYSNQELALADTTGIHFNEGQYYASRITVNDQYDAASDERLCVRLENRDTAGAVDFCFCKRTGNASWAVWQDGAWNERGYIKKDDFCGFEKAAIVNASIQPESIPVSEFRAAESAGQGVYLVSRGLDRGGRARIKLYSSVKDAAGNEIATTQRPFVRHRLAAVLTGSFYNLMTTGCGSKFKDKKWGWTQHPSRLDIELKTYKEKTSSYPVQFDPFAAEGYVSRIADIILSEPKNVFANTKIGVNRTFSSGGVKKKTYPGPNGYDPHLLIFDVSYQNGQWRCPYHQCWSQEGTPPSSLNYLCGIKDNSSKFNTTELLEQMQYWNDRHIWLRFDSFMDFHTYSHQNDISVIISLYSVSQVPDDYELRWFVNGLKISYRDGDGYWWDNLDNTPVRKFAPRNNSVFDYE